MWNLIVVTISLLCSSSFCSQYEVFTHGPFALEHHDIYDCSSLQGMYPESTSGVYTINPSDKKGPMTVFCDLNNDGGAWLVIQRRTDGSENFARSWYEYQQGFGNEIKEFWLGNENIHRLTQTVNMELRINIELPDGKSGYAHYDSFSLGDVTSFYELQTEGFSGNIGDGLLPHNCIGFSTIDVDTDKSPGSCAASYHGGWWYNDCETANLNGDFNISGPTGIVWKTWGDNHIIKSEMKIRPNRKYSPTKACHHEVVWKDCTEVKSTIPTASSGIYTLDPDNLGSFKAYCDMETDGGGWMVIQRRDDGSVNFTRTFHEYAVGFGDLTDEFYIGNELLHRLTEHKPQQIRFDLQDFNDTTAFEVYDNFYIYSSRHNYKLTVGKYYGSAGDSFSYHNGYKFTTIDADHDVRSHENCAKTYRGGWWYRSWHASNLNGEYNKTNRGQGINWKTFVGPEYSLKFCEMKIKPEI